MSKIYTTVEDPIYLKKNLLTNNINLIEVLESFENLRELRKEKYKTFLVLRAYIKEIHNLLIKLKFKFPKIESGKEDELRKEVEAMKLDSEDYVSKGKEIDNLERELLLIREKLKEVS